MVEELEFGGFGLPARKVSAGGFKFQGLGGCKG